MGAKVIVKMQVNAASPDADVEQIKEFCKKEIEAFDAKINNMEVKPLAFGLKAVVVDVVLDEEKGGTEELEKKLEKPENIASVQVIQVSRALG